MSNSIQVDRGEVSRPSYSRWKHWTQLEQHSDADDHRYRRIVSALGLREGATILEIGFGAGTFLSWARTNRYRVTGVEVDPVLIDRAAAAGYRVIQYSEFVANPASVGPLDAVLALDVAEHLSADQLLGFFGAISASLDYGGAAYIQIPNAGSPLSNNIQFGDPTHQFAFTRGSLDYILEGSRLRVVAWAAAIPRTPATMMSRVVERTRLAGFNVLRGSSRLLCGTGFDWWPVAAAILRMDSHSQEKH